jgi:hypothetical protein
MTRRSLRRAIAALLLCTPAACDRLLPNRADLSVPDADEVAAVYARHGVVADVTLNGNVVEVRVAQPTAQLARGGSLWARVGPYIYVFSPATREVFDTWGGVAGVRAMTTAGSGGAEVARALLTHDRLNDVTWQRALNLLGTALQEGTERPSRLEALVAWGEEHTQYEYNEDYVPNRS